MPATPFNVSTPDPAPMISQVPQFNVSDPEPAPMISQLPIPPQRRDWNPPPEGWSRNYSEPVPTAAAATGMNAKSLKEAQEAVEMAMRFQGMRGFQDDLAKGVAPGRALLNNARNIFFNSPAALVQAIHQSTPFAAGPVQGQHVLDPKTKKPIPGYFAVPGQGGAMNIRQVADPEDPAAKKALDWHLGRIKASLKEQGLLRAFPVGSKTRTDAEVEIARLETEANNLLHGKAGAEEKVKKRLLKWTPNGFVE